MRLIIHWFIRALSLMIVAMLFPGFHVANFGTAFIAVAVLTILNVTVKPILVIFSLPVTILTFGLFSFVINAVVFLMASALVPGILIDGFFPALIASLLFSVVSAVLQSFATNK
jgi:putative membrane protein